LRNFFRFRGSLNQHRITTPAGRKLAAGPKRGGPRHFGPADKPLATGKIGCTTVPDLPIIALRHTAESEAIALDASANTTIAKVS
jgi:hypothetical protein